MAVISFPYTRKCARATRIKSKTIKKREEKKERRNNGTCQFFQTLAILQYDHKRQERGGL